jgi:UDP-N-acetylglucosamine--N-acetylmuramyl-(pentapeptide) pyrophosphoryl-undecaprenol N-acetylglucosamine transferase
VFRTRTHIGVYVDDAPGPVARASAIVPNVRSQVTLLSRVSDLGDALPGRVLQVRLPAVDDDTRSQDAAERPVPRSLGAAGAAELLVWMEQERPDLLFVDGPADVAVFARLAGVPVVLLRRPGRTSVSQRQLLDRATLGMLAPYPDELASPNDPDAPRTVHVGLISRFAGRPKGRASARRQLGLDDDSRLVTVLAGSRGLGNGPTELAAAVAATPGWRWHLLGEVAGAPIEHPSVSDLGWVADPWPHLLAADVVLAGASPSSVAEVADAGVPLVVLPRRTRDGEERRFADALGGLGAAVPLGAWPAPQRWKGTLDAASRMDPGPLASLAEGRAATRAAEWLDAWAAMPVAGHTDGPFAVEDGQPSLEAEFALVPGDGAPA